MWSTDTRSTLQRFATGHFAKLGDDRLLDRRRGLGEIGVCVLGELGARDRHEGRPDDLIGVLPPDLPRQLVDPSLVGTDVTVTRVATCKASAVSTSTGSVLLCHVTSYDTKLFHGHRQ